jgi:tetratricopeptide (TPR) repeat protein
MCTLDEDFEEVKQLFDQEKYLESIAIATSIIDKYKKESKNKEYKETFSEVYKFIALSHCCIKEYDKAISFCDKAITLGFDNVRIYIIKAGCSFSIKRYEEAIVNIDLADKKGGRNDVSSPYYHIKVMSYAELKKDEDAVEYLLNSGLTDLEIYSLYNKNYSSLISKMFDLAIKNNDNTNFFMQALQKDENLFKDGRSNEYKSIYLKILELTYLLHVNSVAEKNVAHYTKKETLEKLLFENAPLRMNTVVTANDPQEGCVLLDYLCLCDNVPKYRNEDYQSFITSFTFNHDCLNQFRLYGKEDNKEATGVSFVVNSDFFSPKVTGSDNFIDTGSIEKSEEAPKKSLYRCLYIDPETKEVISIGHRETYTFYRENQNKKDTSACKNEEELDKYISDYKQYISKTLSNVKEKLKALKKQIENDEELKHEVIADLLMMLRYLTKHMAFKEEQECRILSLESLKDNERIKPGIDEKNYNQMYIDYLPIKDYVKNIYFAPKTQGIGMFKDQLKRYGIACGCWKSKHPFA